MLRARLLLASLVCGSAVAGWLTWSAKTSDPLPVVRPPANLTGPSPTARTITRPAHEAPTEADPGRVRAERDRTAKSSGRFTRAVRGHLVDPLGRGLGGLDVATANTLATTGPDGSFTARADRRPEAWRLEHDGWTLLAWTTFDPDSGAEAPWLVGQPAADLYGSLETHDGNAVAGAQVEIQVDPQALAELPQPTAGLTWNRWRTQSKPDGTFDLLGCPIGLNADLVVTQGADEVFRAALSELGTPIRVALPATDGTGLAGLVLANGQPVAGATVHWGSRTTRSGTAGRFGFSGAAAETPPEQIVAEHPVLGDAVRELTENDLATDVVLVLEEPPVLLEGALVTHDGQPLGGWKLFLLDSGSRRSTAPVTTETDGRFTLRGRAEPNGTLRVCVREHATERVHVFDAVPPGSERRLELPPAPNAERIGSVVATDGLPVRGARVVLRIGSPEGPIVTRTITDPEGRFRLTRIPETTLHRDFETSDASALWITVAGGGILPHAEPLAEEPSPQQIEVVRLSELRIRLTDPPAATWTVELHDQNGQRLPLWLPGQDPERFHLTLSRPLTRLAVGAGRCDVVLLSGGAERGRQSVSLVGGRLSEVTF